jgi:hypothetical protein
MGSTDQRTGQWHLVVFGFVCGDHHGVHDDGGAWDCKGVSGLGRECARAAGGRVEKKVPRSKRFLWHWGGDLWASPPAAEDQALGVGTGAFGLS